MTAADPLADDPRHPARAAQLHLTRRHFFGRATNGIGAAALGSLLARDLPAADSAGSKLTPVAPAAHGGLHFAPKAKRVISLMMSGAPSQFETFDYKPKLDDLFDQDLPESVRNGQRLTTMTSGQDRFPLAPSKFSFRRHGQSGAWVSELLPKTAEVVDDLCFVKSMWTEAINHDPAITYIQTGSQLPGRPSAGAWCSYGLGSLNEDLPTFVVLQSSWTGNLGAQALYNRLWGSAFLPTRHSGVALRSKGDPVLYLTDPPGVDRGRRRDMLDALAALNQKTLDEYGDPEVAARIAQYEMAYRMQTSVPELMDLSGETRETLDLFGPQVTTPGTFAANCLLARRLAERDVRFIQVFIRGWDQHNNLPAQITNQCRDVDHGTHGLIRDLKRRGLLEDTLVMWGGEFGRTAYSQGKLTRENYGRDHHPRAFTRWMAGGGVKPGVTYGATDDFSYNITENPVHIHDMNATMLHLLGVDHTKLTARYQGRDFRLTDVHGEVVDDILV